MIEFKPFPKLARLSREVIITEKIDGTNAQVIITEDGEIGAGSRTRLITPGKTTDNYGFAAWVQDNKEDLLKLGPGHHYGEWYGQGIQRGYGLSERRFALFNTSRWRDNPDKPKCCEVVPVLVTSLDRISAWADAAMQLLATEGSYAVEGFMNPEGIVLFHTASGTLFKKTFEGDEHGKEAMKARTVADKIGELVQA